MFCHFLPPNPTLRDRWGWLLYWLFEGMARDWRRRGLRHVHEREIGQRIMGLWKRLNLVILRWEAGTLRPTRGRGARRCVLAAATPHPDPPPQGGREKSGWSVLPRRFGWLRSLLMAESQGHLTAFSTVLDDPEMKAIMAAAPQVGRIIRPFCHFLGIETPAELVLPKRKRRAPPTLRLSEKDEAELARVTARFPDTPPARAAKRALRRMFAGLPVDVTKLSAVAYGYFVHPPRDDNCPPPEIGYGGRALGPLPKDYAWPERD